jgi:hypothetical protein
MKGIALAMLTCLVLAAGCGKYGGPVRPEPPSYDQGRIYDAGQPIRRGQQQQRGQEQPRP